MSGRIKRPITVVAAATLALLLAAPGAALAKGPGGGGTGGGGTGGGGTGGGGTGGGGTGGGGTGGGGGGTTSKGTIFGDLIMVLRDVNGVPITTYLAEANVDCVQPITDVDTGTPAPTDVNVYDYDDEMFLIPLVGGTDPAVACDIDATAGYTPIEVDFGRLSVGRSPERVLAKQLTDVVTAINTDTDGLTLDASGRIVANDAAFDSPLQNLAIYQSLLETTTLTGLPAPFAVEPLDFWELAAAAFAGAADKTAAQTIDTVQYMNRILNIPAVTSLTTLPFADSAKQYLSFADFRYNRSDMFPGCITYWDLTDIDNPVAMKDVPIIEAVFGGTEGTDLENAKAFASMVDDARQVLLFVHDQVEISVDPIGVSDGCTNPVVPTE